MFLRIILLDAKCIALSYIIGFIDVVFTQ